MPRNFISFWLWNFQWHDIPIGITSENCVEIFWDIFPFKNFEISNRSIHRSFLEWNFSALELEIVLPGIIEIKTVLQFVKHLIFSIDMFEDIYFSFNIFLQTFIPFFKHIKWFPNKLIILSDRILLKFFLIFVMYNFFLNHNIIKWYFIKRLIFILYLKFWF